MTSRGSQGFAVYRSLTGFANRQTRFPFPIGERLSAHPKKMSRLRRCSDDDSTPARVRVSDQSNRFSSKCSICPHLLLCRCQISRVWHPPRLCGSWGFGKTTVYFLCEDYWIDASATKSRNEGMGDADSLNVTRYRDGSTQTSKQWSAPPTPPK